MEQAKDFQRRLSLVPPGGGTPGISLISDESPISERPRRLSAQSLGPISVSLFGESRRGSIASSRRSSTDRPRRPSTHSVGILPISMFGEGGEKPRRPSTHSLRVFPTGYLEEEFDGPTSDRSRRPSSQSLGPFFFVSPNWWQTYPTIPCNPESLYSTPLSANYGYVFFFSLVQCVIPAQTPASILVMLLISGIPTSKPTLTKMCIYTIIFSVSTSLSTLCICILHIYFYSADL